jgi:Carboxypeptidase regulatory-like domain
MDWLRRSWNGRAQQRSASVLLVCSMLLFTARAAAQESRATITGRVIDSSGGVLPGVTVTVINLETNSPATAITNENGQYTILYVTPSTYRVSAELSGFKKALLDRVEVRVGDRTQLDFTLEAGGITEEVQVTADSPLLETGSATLGQVIDSKLIQEIPLGDGTAYGLTRLVGGATFERSYALQRPMDNDNLRGLTVSGTINSEFTIDGSSNVGSQARVAIQPPADAIQEFKVEAAAYDAQIGHTGAGNVNLALRSGGNAMRVAASYYNRDDSRSANLFASNRLGTGKTPRDYNRYSATVSGPIKRNKTFFMGSFEKLQDDTIEAVTTSVPTERMRAGDFSELLSRGVQIYNPFTAQNVGGTITRQPFAGNIIPSNLINPIAANVLKQFPLPNQTPAADLSQNYFAEQPWTYGYWFYMGRVDQEWTPSNKTYVRYIENFRREERYNFAFNPITQGATDRYNHNVAVGHTAILSPTLILDVKGSWLKFNDDQTPHESFDLASLGYSSSVLALLGEYDHIPRFDVEAGTLGTAGRVAILGGQQNGFNTGRVQPFYNVQFAPTLNKIVGNHSFKIGYDWRQLQQKEVNQGFRGGYYNFDGTYTRSANNVTGQYGQGIAAFVLGIPTAGRVEIRPEQQYSVTSHGVFVQDDWRVTSNLTVNLGLRYDYELGMKEKENRNVRGFDVTTPNPIQAQVATRYAASPPAGVPFSAQEFAGRVVGGYQYLSDDEPYIWDADKNNIQPRLGFTYKLGAKNVVRGGAGLYVAPFQITGVPGLNNPINQRGYAQDTPVPVTTDSGLTFQGTLSNPVPSGQLLQPVGSSLGLLTNLGGSPGTIFSTTRKNPQYWRYSIGIERELPWNMVTEISYLGQHGQNLPILEAQNYVPQQYRTQSATRDAAAETFLSQVVSNPFQGLFPENPGSNGTTIARRRLLLQYPQFDTLNLETYRGTNTYHGVVVRLDKRFTKGVMIMSSYTWSRLREKVAPLNPWENLEDRVSPVDRPHRVTFASVLELPFGTGRRFGDGWNGLTNAVLGGWQFAAKYEWQTGQPLTWNNNTYYDPSCGSPSGLKSQWGKDDSGQFYGVDIPIFDTTCFYTVNGQPITNAQGQVITFQDTNFIPMGAANIRRFPTTIESVRFMNHHLLDLGLTKNFEMGRTRLQVRIEALNATNYTLFNVGNVTLAPTNASFAKLNNLDSSTVMKPRDIQLGVRVVF